MVAVLKGLVDATESEPGTELYVLNLDAADADTVWFYELYTDGDAAKAHSTSDAMKTFGGQLAGLVAGAPELHFVTPHLGKGVAIS
jgi:quinol monooxygenase YgiN